MQSITQIKYRYMKRPNGLYLLRGLTVSSVWHTSMFMKQVVDSVIYARPMRSFLGLKVLGAQISTHSRSSSISKS